DDDVDESADAETIILTLTAPDTTMYPRTSLGTATAATVTITDDNDASGLPTLIIAGSSDVTEGNPGPAPDPITFTVSTFNDVAVAANLSVEVAVSQMRLGSGTTASDVSYIAAGDVTTHTVTIATGTSSASFTLAVPGDRVNQSGGRITGTIVMPDGTDTYRISGTLGSASIRVEDDDIPAITIAATDTAGTEITQVNEGESFHIVFTAAPGQPLDIVFDLFHTATQNQNMEQSYVVQDSLFADNKATFGDLRDPVVGMTETSVTLVVDTIVNGRNGTTSGGDTITVMLDVDMLNDTARLYEGSRTQYTRGATTEVSVAIIGDTVAPPALPVVSIDPVSSDPTVNEGAPALFAVSVDAPMTGSLTVAVSLSQTGNYFTPGQASTTMVTVLSNGRSSSFQVPTLDDDIDEDFGRIVATIQAMPDDYDLGTPTSATITVRDNDAATVSITPVSTSVRESGSATFTISTGNIAPGASLVVQLAVSETAGSYLDGIPPSRITIGATNTTAILSVALDDDGEVEGPGMITASIVLSGGTTTSGGYTLAAGASSATVIALDNDVAITATVTQVVEDAGPALRFAVSRGNTSPAETFVVTVSQTGDFIDMVSTSGGSAIAVGADSSVQYPLTLANGIAVGRLDIALDDDDVTEANGRITATLTSVPAVYALGVGTSSASATVLDNDGPTLTLADASAQEGQELEFVVTLTGAVENDVSFEYDTSVGNATENDDYFPFRSVRRATIPAGQSTLTLRVQTNTDNLDEPDEFMRLFILKASVVNASFGPGSGINDNFATGTIIDINAPVLLIAAGTSTAVTEGPGAVAPFVISLSTNSVRVGVAVDFEVRVNNSGNDVRRRSNYLTADPLTLTGTLMPGEASVTVNVPIHDDMQDEVNGSISASLPMPTDGSYTVLRNNFARVSVNDDDVTGVTIAAGAAVEEGLQAEFFITPVTTPTAELSVVVQVDNGSGNFLPGTPPLTRTVTVPAGTTTDVSFSVPTDNDNLNEPDGSIIASIQPDSSYSSNQPSTATVTVRDNDAIHLALGAVQAMESGNLQFELKLTDGGPDPRTSTQNIIFLASTADGARGSSDSATAPADYTAFNNESITIAAGESAATITVTLIDDSDDEPNETLTLTVTGSINGEAVSVSARGTIEDDDDATISISAANSSLTEADTAVFIVSNGGIAQEAALPVSISIDNGTDDNFLPGTPPLNLSVTIARGNNTATLNVALDDDSTDEPNGSITATVTTGTGYAPATDGTETTTINVADNDVPTVTLAASASSATEGDTITFTLTAGAVQSADVDVIAAVFGGSFLRNQPAIVTFTITTGNSTASRDITTDDDSLDEADGEIALRLIASGIPADYLLGDPSQVTVSVSDNDDPRMPGLSLANASAIESASTMDFRLALSIPAPTALTLYVSTRDGNSASNDPTATATAPADYTALVMQEVVLNTGDTGIAINVALANDTTDERNEQFTLIVSDDAAGNNTLLEAIGTIFDDDDTSVSISTGASTITEGQDAVFTITATVQQDAELTVTVSVTETGGEHITGRDPQRYRDRIAVIPYSFSTAVLRVPTDDDRFEDATGTITAAVQGGTGYSPDATNGSVEVTVNDNDGATPVVTIGATNTNRVTEGEPAVFTLTSSIAQMTPLVVSVMLSEDGDFIDSTAATLTSVADGYTVDVSIAAGSRTATLTVATDGDMVLEADGSLWATVQDGADYDPGRAASQRIRVLDDGTQVPTVSIANASAEEGMPIFFIVTLSAAPGEAFALMYETNDGTATSGGSTEAGTHDYGGPPGAVSLHFGAAATARTIRIGLPNDQVDEGDETFTLRLFSDANPAVVEFDGGGSATTVTGTITDNDTSVSISAASNSVAESGEAIFTLTAAAAQSADIPVRIRLLEGTRNGRVIGILDAAGSNPALTPADPTNIGTLIGGEYTVQVTIPANSASTMFTVALDDDMLDEPEANFTATVERVRDGRNYLPDAANNSVTIQVTDDDLPVVSIRASNTTILEGNDIVYVLAVSPVQSAGFNVDMLHRRDVRDTVTNPAGPIFPSFSVPSAPTILGTSNATGSEYRGMATIPAGQASLVVTIETTSVGTSQGATADVSIRSNAAYTIDATAITVALVSEDLPQLSGANPTASEGDGSIEFVLTLNKAPIFPVSVSYATSSGRLPNFPSDPSPAINAEDFIGVSGVLRFDASNTVATVTVAIVDDDTPGEGDESFWLLFSDEKNVSPVQGRLGTITDNDGTIISIAAATTTAPDGTVVDVIATEGEPALFVLAANSSRHTTAVTVNVNLSQMGNFLSDATTTSVSATIGAGESSATLSIATDDDDLDEPGGSITATLQASASYRVAAEPDNGATVQVADNDDPLVSIAALNTPVDEGEFAAFVVSATVIQDSWLTVSIAVTETGNVIRTTALSPLPTLAVINPGENTATLNVATDDDDIDEPNSTIIATIQMGAGYSVAAASSAEVVVTAADEAPVVPVGGAGLRISDVTAREDVGMMNFAVTLTPASASTAMTVTVDYTTLDDSAVAGANEDYIAASGTLTLVAAPTTVTMMTGGSTTTMESNPPVTVTISVTINDDMVSEDTESFTLLLSNLMPDTIPFIQSSAIGIINDDDPPIVGIARPAGEIREGEGAVFRFTLNRLVNVRDEFVINLLAAEDPGGYLTEAAPTTVTIAAGEYGAALTLATTDDDDIEADSFIRLAIDTTATHYATRSGQISATVRVTSEDRATLAISPVANSVVEGSPAEFEITATVPGMLMLAPDAALNVGLMLSEQGDFIDGSNAALTYISNGIYSASVSLTAGSLTATLTVATLDDDVDEANGNITATLQTGSLYTLSIPPGETTANASVGVTDDDLPSNLSLSLAGASATEGADATLEFVLTLSAAASEAITIEASTSDGTATTADGDYTAINARQVSFAIGETRQTITVAVLDDTDVEPAIESLYLALSNPMPSDLTLTNSQARGDIRDDEAPVISIAADATPVTEGTAAVFILTSSATRPDHILVQVDVSQMGDYRTPGAAGRLSLRLLPNQSTATLTVTTTDDSMDEGDGSITATLVTGPGYLTAGSPGNIATIVLEDDDATSISIRPVADSVAESDPATPALFTITATSVQATALTVGVGVVETGGFIDPPLPAMAVIPDGQSSVVLTVKIRADNGVRDPDSIVTATLLDGGDSYNLGAPISAEVLVRDASQPLDPAQRPVVDVGTVAPADVPEDGGAIRFSITLDRATSSTVRVAYQTTDGMATAPADYEAQIGTLVFVPGETTSQTVAVAIVDDAIDEADESFSLVILSATNASIGMASAGGTIVDNDDTMVSISATTPTVSEGGSAPQFALMPSLRLNAPLMVSVSLDNAPGSDFLQGTPPLLRTLTIPMNTVSHPFTFSNALDDDGIPEADGSIVITLLDGDDYNPAPAPGNSATVSVTDDDRPTVSIVASASTATEGTDGHAEFIVSTATAVDAALPVNVFVSFNSYIALADVRAHTLTIGASGTSATLTVAILDDDEDEADGVITASLQTAATYDIATDAATATVAVSDDDEITVSVAVVGQLAITEADDAVFSITATTPPTADLSVAVEIANGREDYDFLPDSLIDLAAGNTTATLTITIGASSTSAAFTVALDDDGLDEPDGTIRALVLAGTGYTANTIHASLLVRDNDDLVGTPTLTAADASAAESAGQIEFVLTLTNPTDAEVTALLYYLTADGTAEAGSDYEAIVLSASRPGRPGRGRPIGFVAGASSSAARTITVTLLDDDIEEPTETFTLNFTPASGIDLNEGGAVENSLTGTIIDDDGGVTYRFMSNSVRQDEGTPMEFVLLRSAEVTVSTGEAVTYALDYTG
ncbi:MAG: Calx-beta domain-containing protein, partial [Pseudohongiellaceae bacterium]